MAVDRIRRKFSVSCGKRDTVVLAEDTAEAIERAIPKMYGPRTFWLADSGLPGYGQVFEALQPTKRNSNPGNSSVTNRVSIDVRATAPKSRAFLNQERDDAEASREWRQNEDRQKHIEDIGFAAAIAKQPRITPDQYVNDGYRWLYGYDNGIEWLREKACRDSQNKEREDSERYWEQRRRDERMTSLHTEALSDNADFDARFDARMERITAEVARIRSLSDGEIVTDAVMLPIIRNTIAPGCAWKRDMPLGEFKRKLLNGEYPEIIRDYVESDMLFRRLKYVID